MRWKLIHNVGYRFSPQTPLSSKFLARCSLSSLSGSEILFQKLGDPHGDASWDFPIGSAGKEPPAYEGDTGNTGSNSVSAPRVGSGTPLPYSCLKIHWTEEPGRPQSIGPQTVRHNWARVHTHTHTHTQDVSYETDAMGQFNFLLYISWCSFFNVSHCVSIHSLNIGKSKVSVLATPFLFAFSERLQAPHSFPLVACTPALGSHCTALIFDSHCDYHKDLLKCLE